MARTGYIHRIWSYIWWFPSQKYRICTVYIYTYMVLANPMYLLLTWLSFSSPNLTFFYPSLSRANHRRFPFCLGRCCCRLCSKLLLRCPWGIYSDVTLPYLTCFWETLHNQSELQSSYNTDTGISRVNYNRACTPYMTVCMVDSLPKVP